jgi:hypothetical protein
MKTQVFLVSFLLCASGAWAQITLPPGSGGAPPAPQSCAGTKMYNRIWQRVEGTRLYSELNGIFRTQRTQSGCVGLPRVEAWIQGLPGDVMIADALSSGGNTAEYRMTGRWAPDGQWQSWSKHWLRTARQWFWVGYDHDSAVVDTTPAPTPEEMCYLQGSDYYWDGFDCVYAPGSPIIVDVARNGYHLTSVDRGVWFDLDADGTPEFTAWTKAGSDDAFLAMDRNGNGRIDDGSELFGNNTPAYANQKDLRAKNGFEALDFLHTPEYGASFNDKMIDARDAQFGRLLLWCDANHNGISEPDELTSLANAGVRAIGTEYKERKRVDRFGNEFRQKGEIFWSDGAKEPVFDIWLKWKP